MTVTGSRFAELQRQQVVRELEWLRRQGITGAQQLLNIITAENYAEVWPYVAPLFDELMRIQQQGSRRLMQGYLIGSTLATGALIAVNSRPTIDPYVSYRDGRLPSGMPWIRLLTSFATAVDHRVENGMSLNMALHRTKMTLFGAASSQGHAEFRLTARDLLRSGSQMPDGSDLIPSSRTEVRPGQLVERSDGVTVVAPERDLDAERFLPEWDPLSTATPVRWIRQPNAGACSWCILQASRGAIFYTEQTAVSAGHTNCKCATFPEPKPGAYRDVILYDPRDISGQLWKNHRGVQQDVSVFGSKYAKVRLDLRLEQSNLTLAS
jgi:hypothetical protein